jgi:hypothetical protein
MRFRRTCTATLLSLLGLGSELAGAQRVEYARTPGDTLHFLETTHIDATSKGRAGPLQFSIDQSARLSLTFLTADSAAGAYDSLVLTMHGPTEGKPISVTPGWRSPFQLRMRTNGDVETLRSPELPPLARDIADYLPPFEGFFPRLPLGDLRPGATRIDTVTRKETSAAGRRLSTRRIVHVTVAGDTMVGSAPATLLNIQVEIHIESSAHLQQQPYTADLVLEGSENGTALIAGGRLLSRERTGELRGTTTYNTGATTLVVNQSYTFRVDIAAVESRHR